MRIWTILAIRQRYPNPEPMKGKWLYEDFTEVKVVADTEREAKARAKDIIKRKYYVTRQVYEAPDNTISQDMQMKDLEIRASMLKELKKYTS